MSQEFFRTPSNEELRDFKAIPLAVQKNSIQAIFKRKIEQVENEYLQQKKKPFCSRCAKMDFQDKLDSHQQELSRKVRDQMRSLEKKEGYANTEKMDFDMDLSKYGDPDRFETGKDREAMEPRPGVMKEGQIVRQEKTGVHRDYRCKIRGCGISMFLSFDDLKKQDTDPKITDLVKVKR